MDRVRRAVVLLAASFLLLGLTSGGTHPLHAPVINVLQFDTAPIADRPLAPLPIAPQRLDRLTLGWRIDLPERADGAPLFVGGVHTADGTRDLVIVETVAGRVVALDAENGETVWQITPPPGPRFTTSSPAIDPIVRWLFAYGLDGFLHKYDLRDGREIAGAGFPALITKKPDVEKGSSDVTIAKARDGRTFVYMTTSAYPDPGDEGDYQGHLVTINIDTGEKRIFNALCSDRETIFDESGGEGDCAQLQAGIWARTAVTYDTVTDRIFVTTGNGAFDANYGGHDWGSSVVALRPDGSTDAGTPLDSYTPDDYQRLTDEDLDLSSTTIAILPAPRRLHLPRLGVQSGKDGRIRLLDLGNLSGTGAPRATGGELQLLALPQGGPVRSQPEAWFDAETGETWLFIANNSGVSGFELRVDDDGAPKLVPRWTTKAVQGTSPVLANGILFVAGSHALRALDARTGAMLWQDTSIGEVHWQSPAVVSANVFLADNDGHMTMWQVR